jgi:hypothetical protein
MRKPERFVKFKYKKNETGAKKFLGMYKRRKLRIIVDKRIENYMPFFAPVSFCQINLNNRFYDTARLKILRFVQLFIVSNRFFIPASIY